MIHYLLYKTPNKKHVCMFVDIMRWGYSMEELGRSVLLILQTLTLVKTIQLKPATKNPLFPKLA